MSKAKPILGLTLIGVLALAAVTIVHHGYPPLIPPSSPGVKSMFETLMSSWPGRLSALNQSIATILIMIWIWFDCGKRVLVIAFYSVLTALLGIPGPLLYLLLRKPVERGPVEGQ